MNEQPVIPGEEDIAERIAGFNAAIQTLLGKYELGLSAQPFVNPNGTLGANPILLSARKPKEAVVNPDEPTEVEKEAAPKEEPAETLID